MTVGSACVRRARAQAAVCVCVLAYVCVLARVRAPSPVLPQAALRSCKPLTPRLQEDELNVGVSVNYGVLSPEEKEYLADPAGYAEAHPEEALKIHLKRKAERQAALREEYKKEREEMIERLSETNRARNVIVAILATIVIITVLIDMSANYVKENCGEFSRPVVEILFMELAILGCIALLVFMSVKTGIPEEISEQVGCGSTHHGAGLLARGCLRMRSSPPGQPEADVREGGNFCFYERLAAPEICYGGVAGGCRPLVAVVCPLAGDASWEET